MPSSAIENKLSVPLLLISHVLNTVGEWSVNIEGNVTTYRKQRGLVDETYTWVLIQRETSASLFYDVTE